MTDIPNWDRPTVKMNAKRIVLRLQPLILSLVHTDQVGFVQGREAAKIPVCLLSVDAEKAFDRVGWPFFKHSLM